MKKVNCNKLVRDRIPNIIIGHGLSFKARKLDAVEFENELTNKLIEEANEVAEKVQWLNHKCEQEPVSKEEHTLDMQEIKEELADVLEVYVHLVKSLGLTTNDIEVAANEKRAKRGSFEDRIYLEWVEDVNEANKKGRLKWVYSDNNSLSPYFYTIRDREALQLIGDETDLTAVVARLLRRMDEKDQEDHYSRDPMRMRFGWWIKRINISLSFWILNL